MHITAGYNHDDDDKVTNLDNHSDKDDDHPSVFLRKLARSGGLVCHHYSGWGWYLMLNLSA